MEPELAPQPRRLSPSRKTTSKAFPAAKEIGGYEVLGWEDGAFRVVVLGADGEPLNNRAVIGLNLAEGSTDAQVETALRAFMNPR